VIKITTWFCIPPANWLKRMDEWRYHMIIAPHLFNSWQYYAYYKHTPHLYKILDNGLWEGEVIENEKLLDTAIELRCQEIIAPDDKSGEKTLEMTHKFLALLTRKDLRKDFLIHGVVHGETEREMKGCLKGLLDLGVDIIDMPKMLGVNYRTHCLHVLREQFNSNIPVHFLGFYKEELEILRDNKDVRSFDTSVPFKPRYGAKFDLHLPYNLKNIILIERRIKKYMRDYKDESMSISKSFVPV